MENNTSAEAMSRSRFPDGFRILKGKQEYVTYIEHSSIRVWYSETPWQYESHCHSAVEIIMPVKGEVIYTVAEDSVYRVQSNEVLIVPPNWVHSLIMHEGSARYLLLFEPDNIFNMRDMQLVEGMLKSPIYLTGQSESQESIRQLLTQVVGCYERREFLWNSLCYSYLLQMYARLGQFNMTRELRRYDAKSQRIDPEIVDSARLYIDQNYMRDITLGDVSEFTGFSRCYFSRVFKQQLGQSFSEYLRHKRISMAEELLIHSRQPIQEIAMSAGFGSVATFNRVFRDTKNCTPSRYREIYGDFIK
ncbi:MAG: helix-turn-helix domain-containing protein [Clostridia bacterium]|nr:helix-turn-helix domain-containing protein [Clostridia bacterium]